MQINDLPGWLRPKIVLAEHVYEGQPCWRYTGKANTGDGYSQIKRKGKKYLVHRIVYELLVAPIGKGLVVDHICRNRWCCNPYHLRDVTIKENTYCGEGVNNMFMLVERDYDPVLFRAALNLEVDANAI